MCIYSIRRLSFFVTFSLKGLQTDLMFVTTSMTSTCDEFFHHWNPKVAIKRYPGNFLPQKWNLSWTAGNITPFVFHSKIGVIYGHCIHYGQRVNGIPLYWDDSFSRTERSPLFHWTWIPIAPHSQSLQLCWRGRFQSTERKICPISNWGLNPGLSEQDNGVLPQDRQDITVLCTEHSGSSSMRKRLCA